MTPYEVVPCPTCLILADLLPARQGEALRRSSCARGHENSIAPTVLRYLQELLGPAWQ